MKNIWQLYKESFKLFRENIHQYIGYQLLTKLILFIILIPGFQFVFNILMKSRGYNYITNGLLIKFLMSPQGVLLVMLSLVIGFISILLELGGLIILTHQLLQGENQTRFYNIIRYTLSKIKYLIGLDGLIICFYFVIIAPLIDANIKASVFETLRIPSFVMDVINSNIFYFTILGIGFVLVIIFSIRWVFSLHVLLLEPEDNKRFLKQSGRIMKGHVRHFIKYTFSIALIQLLIVIVLFLVYLFVSVIILMNIRSGNYDVVITLLISFGTVAFFILSSFILPTTIIRVTQMYYQFASIEPETIKFKTYKRRSKYNHVLSSKLTWLMILVILIIGTIVYSYILEASINYTRYQVDVTAHRGSSKKAPENTMAAIDLAIKNGADYAEIDVHLTKDHEIILLHDTTFLRTAGVNKKPRDMTLEEIKKLDVGLWFSKEFKDEPVPTLQEVMRRAKGEIKLNIELKSTKYTPELITKVIELIEIEEFKDDCVVSSIDYKALESIETIKPSIKTGYIMFVAIGDLEDLVVDFYSIEESNVTEAFITSAHILGREVHVWTINSEAAMNEMLAFGVDNIITDYDLRLKNIIDQKK